MVDTPWYNLLIHPIDEFNSQVALFNKKVVEFNATMQKVSEAKNKSIVRNNPELSNKANSILSTAESAKKYIIDVGAKIKNYFAATNSEEMGALPLVPVAVIMTAIAGAILALNQVISSGNEFLNDVAMREQVASGKLSPQQFAALKQKQAETGFFAGSDKIIKGLIGLVVVGGIVYYFVTKKKGK